MGGTRWLRQACGVACALALGSIAVACSGDDRSSSTIAEEGAEGSAVPGSAPDATVTNPAGDGELTVGVLLPLTGPGSELGTVMSEAVELARAETEAAGVQTRTVRLVVVDESTLDSEITPSLEEIFNEEVDAVIGPASSLLAARMLPITVSAGVLTCSPTASALSLDDFPDAGPLFVRTIPSDSMQAQALALMLDGAGTEVALAYVDDAYGRPFMERVREELDRLGAPVADVIPFDPQESDYASNAQELVQSGAATIGIIGDPQAGPRLVQSLAEVIDPSTVTRIWMNDAMRVPATASVYRRLDDRILSLMHGVSPRSTIDAPDDTGSARTLPDNGRFFAANAYDCMSVIALAADQAEFIDGAAMADQIQQVTSGGTSCDSFVDCFEQLRSGRGIDYDGPSGELDIGRDGDPTRGLFDMYRFDERGLDVTEDRDPIRVDNRNG